MPYNEVNKHVFLYQEYNAYKVHPEIYCSLKLQWRRMKRGLLDIKKESGWIEKTNDR